jgi:hypothetical protein
MALCSSCYRCRCYMQCRSIAVPHTAAQHVTSLAGGLATAGTAALPAPLAADASNSSDDLIITHDTQSSAAHTGDADVYLEPHPRASGMCLAGMELTFRLRQPLIRPLIAGSSTLPPKNPPEQPRNLKRKVGEGVGKSPDIRSFYRSRELSEQAPSWLLSMPAQRLSPRYTSGLARTHVTALLRSCTAAASIQFEIGSDDELIYTGGAPISAAPAGDVCLAPHP